MPNSRNLALFKSGFALANAVGRQARSQVLRFGGVKCILGGKYICFIVQYI